MLYHLVSSVSKLLSFVHQLHSLVLSTCQSVSTLAQSHIHPVDYITHSACDTLARLTYSYTHKKYLSIQYTPLTKPCPEGSVRGKVKGSANTLAFILWGPSISAASILT